MYYKRPRISKYLRNNAALNELANFSGSTPVRRLLFSKPPRKFVQTSFAQKPQFIGHILSLTVKAHVRSATYGQL